MNNENRVEPTFDELMFEPVRVENIRHMYAPKHLSRRDLRRWERARRWNTDRFDTQLAIGGIVAASLCVFLMVVGIVASLEVK